MKQMQLNIIDHHWTEHINTLSHLREGIYLRGYGQEDPLRAYTMEGFDLFDKMMEKIDHDITIMLVRADEEIEKIINPNSELETPVPNETSEFKFINQQVNEEPKNKFFNITNNNNSNNKPEELNQAQTFNILSDDNNESTSSMNIFNSPFNLPTPNHNAMLEELNEIEKSINNSNGILWQDIKKELYSKERIKEFDIEADFLSSLIELRNEKKITQKQLEELSGIKQPMIARIENGDTMPRIDTFLRLLEPMGLTLKIVPIKENAKD